MPPKVHPQKEKGQANGSAPLFSSPDAVTTPGENHLNIYVKDKDVASATRACNDSMWLKKHEKGEQIMTEQDVKKLIREELREILEEAAGEEQMGETLPSVEEEYFGEKGSAQRLLEIVKRREGVE